ncbi:glyoxalase superfamily protein [Microlunatus parietis]|uniref:Bleomycin resistance protein n=1 Tax=Microlunatus parietis TaxID=682979 RepID=A0A7Y9LA07_9ACTN|nr:glyoxalase superfamily protein [Microlunatus parietis]NYE69150.1 catechol 2,3-dioxygenase-like lactoylglutathione lyase family enzyme [Microlunatus parietis]
MIILPTPPEAKAQAKRLRRALAAQGVELSHARALELIAATHGVRDWNTLSGLAPAEAPAGAVVPILRIFDWDATQAFYREFLGWTVISHQQFEGHAPRYLRLRGPDGVRIDLSEHPGDGTPGTAILIEISEVAALHAELLGRNFGYAQPTLEDSEHGRTVTLHDPCGNRITYLEVRTAGADRVPDELSPIVHELRVDLDPGAAFDRFTSFSWWRNYGIKEGGRVVIENGEVIFKNPDGAFSIGTITDWQPGRRYAQTFTLAQDPDFPSSLTVTFTADGDGTLVRFEHGGWNATNAGRRGHFAEWPVILAGYTDLT